MEPSKAREICWQTLEFGSELFASAPTSRYQTLIVLTLPDMSRRTETKIGGVSFRDTVLMVEGK